MSQKPGLALKIFIQANYRGLGHAVCFDLPTTGGDRSLEQTAASHLGLQLAVHDTSGFPDVLLYVLTVFRIPYVEFKRVLDGSGFLWYGLAKSVSVRIIHLKPSQPLECK